MTLILYKILFIILFLLVFFSPVLIGGGILSYILIQEDKKREREREKRLKDQVETFQQVLNKTDLDRIKKLCHEIQLLGIE